MRTIFHLCHYSKGCDLILGKPSNDDKPWLRDLQRYGNIGIEFGVTVLVSFGIGYLLDRRLGTTPFFMIVGVLWGVVSSFWVLYRKIMVGEEKKDASKRKG